MKSTRHRKFLRKMNNNNNEDLPELDDEAMKDPLADEGVYEDGAV